jgi:hypothetical protein
MSKARHGGTKMTGGHKPTNPAPPLVGGSPKVAAEADKSSPRFKDGGKVHGKKSMMRLDRPGRKMGGRVGADCSPLSTAAKTDSRSDGKGSN